VLIGFGQILVLILVVRKKRIQTTFIAFSFHAHRFVYGSWPDLIRNRDNVCSKWPIENRIVTWPMTDDDTWPRKVESWRQYVLSPISRKQLEMLFSNGHWLLDIMRGRQLGFLLMHLRIAELQCKWQPNFFIIRSLRHEHKPMWSHYSYAVSPCASAGVMYWGDAYFHRIEAANIDGSGRKTISMATKSRYYSFAFHAGNIYYTDWNAPYVYIFSLGLFITLWLFYLFVYLFARSVQKQQ